MELSVWRARYGQPYEDMQWPRPVFHLFTPAETYRYIRLHEKNEPEANRLEDACISAIREQRVEGYLPYRLMCEVREGTYIRLGEEVERNLLVGREMHGDIHDMLEAWTMDRWRTYVKDCSRVTQLMVNRFAARTGISPAPYPLEEHLEIQLLALAHHYGLVGGRRISSVLSEVMRAREEGLLLPHIPGRE